MNNLRALYKRIAGLFCRDKRDADFAAELEFHLQLQIEDNLRAGMSAKEARRQALIKLGGIDQTEESYRDRRGVPWVENAFRDLQIAVRSLARDPRFSVLAVLGLGLGLGVSTAIFALINASIRDDRAPLQSPASYVGIFGTTNGQVGSSISYADFRFYQNHATSLAVTNAESGHFYFVLGASGATRSAAAEDLSGRFESENFLTTVGLKPASGRSFSKEEALAGAPVAILNFRFWKNYFGADQTVIGNEIVLNSHVLTIVGIADSRFEPLDNADLYLPLELEPLLSPSQDMVHDPELQWLHIDARLRPGVNAREAQAELGVLSKALSETTHKASQRREGIFVSPGGDNPRKRQELMALAVAVTTAVSMILLIACANLANILLARGVTRRREIGIRLSLGATRARVISLLMAESLVLALAGGATGLLFSHWLAAALFRLQGAPPGFALQIDPREFVYTLALSVASAVSFGLGPALAATKSNLAQALHSEGLTAAPRSTWHKIWSPRNVLVVVPLAISLMLLMGAGATLRGMQQHYLGGPSFETNRLTGMRLELNSQGYDKARTREFQEGLRERIATMPGVTAVALASNLPLSYEMGSFPLVTEGSAPASRGASAQTDYNVISSDFFPTIGLTIQRGRNFTDQDREGAQLVAIVNESLVNKYWNNQDPIGRQIRLGTGTGPYFEVVGVAPDFEDPNGPFNTVRPTVYVPYGQEATFLAGIQTGTPSYQMQFLIRTSSDPLGLKVALRQQVLSQDPSLIVHIQTIQEMLDAMLGPVRNISLLLSALGGLALVMASIGIYAIMSYSVSQQTKEIGIRVALGARRRDVLTMVMQRTVKLIASGLAVGLAGGLAVSRISSTVISGFSRLDITTCISVSFVLASVATFASYMPARRAMRVDPIVALRHE